MLESATLRNHAITVSDKAYINAVRQAIAETSLPESAFPTECPHTLEAVLSKPLEAN